MLTARIQHKNVFQLKLLLNNNIAGRRRIMSYPKALGAQNSDAARLRAISWEGGIFLNFQITRTLIRISRAIRGMFAVPTKFS